MYNNLHSQTPPQLTELTGLRLPDKPREVGLTSVLDKGLGLLAMQDLLDLMHPYIDVVKLGWGTSALYPSRLLANKIALLRAADIAVCPGGTLLEIAWAQARTEDFFAFARDAGFTTIEVSDGSYAMPRRAKLNLIERAARLGFCVLSEVGKKSPVEDAKLTPRQRLDCIRQELEAGAWKVILEGRESGTVGIYDATGTVQDDLVEMLVTAFGVLALIFEAPQKSQQVWLIQHYGALVNLGNVPPEEVISVATLRCGLRSDTARPALAQVMQGAAQQEWVETDRLASVA